MPKESKKFINPLLRPSQEAVVALPQPQKNLAPEVQAEGVNNGDGQALPSEKALEKPLRPADLPASLLSTSPDTSTLPSTLPSTFTSTLPSTSPDTSTLPSTSTSTLPEIPPSPSISTLPSTSTSTLPSTDISLETVIHRDELSTSKSRLRKKRSVSERTRDSAIEQSGQDMSRLVSTTAAEPVQEEKKERSMFRAPEPVRRKRGPLAFEKTHERITLWIDKGLKQAFEELAYEQELPKTTLLNEAIADLLKKYDLR